MSFPLREPRKWALPVLVVAVAIPTLLLLVLELQSFRRHREALAMLTASNRVLWEERLGAELENEVAFSAERQLRDPRIRSLAALARGRVTLATARRMREFCERLRVPVHVAEEFYLLREGRVVYPVLHADLAGLWELGERGPWEAAERVEIQAGRPDLALAQYRALYRAAGSPVLQALASLRIARCLQKMRRSQEAAQAWRRLMDQFPDQLDRFGRPYALVAAFELDDAAALRRLSAEFAQGRWELSGDTVANFAGRFRERFPDAPLADTRYLRHFRAAREIEKTFRLQAPPAPGVVLPLAIAGPPPLQCFYTLLEPASPQKGVLVFSADLDRAATDFLTMSAGILGIPPGGVPRVAAVAAAPLEAAPFRAMFPFWRLSLAGEVYRPPGELHASALWAAIMLVAALLALVVVLLARGSWTRWKLSDLRTAFVSGVSHELRTPLTAITLYTETLERGVFSEEERRGFYRVIREQSRRLSELIDGVLEFSRIEKGRKQYQLREGDLAAELARVLDEYREAWEREGVAIHTSLPQALAGVRFDAGAARRALLNLVDNAIKYGGRGHPIEVNLWREDSTAVVEVRDRGVGIPPEEHGRIFGEYYRGRSARGKGGYGLGLFLVRHIMEAHGGRVEVDSRPDEGSSFRLVFPCTRS